MKQLELFPNDLETVECRIQIDNSQSNFESITTRIVVELSVNESNREGDSSNAVE